MFLAATHIAAECAIATCMYSAAWRGFLKNMVPVMGGTLVDIGRGRFEPGHVAWLLQNGDRKKAGATAPACGLCLVNVPYPDKS